MLGWTSRGAGPEEGRFGRGPVQSDGTLRDNIAACDTRVCAMEQPGDDVLGRESFRLWGIALVLSVLLHFGVASVLAGQLWATRDAALTDAVVVAMELIQPTPEPARQERRPVP